MVSVYEYIDKTQLPKEYLPDNYTGEYAGTIQEITGMSICMVVSPVLSKYTLLQFRLNKLTMYITVSKCYFFIGKLCRSVDDYLSGSKLAFHTRDKSISIRKLRLD